MFTIFTTENILCSWARESSDSIWHRILLSQQQIVISRDINSEYADDTDYVINQLENAQIDVYANIEDTKYINDVISSPENILKEPTGAFILDISPSKAKEIQDKYGVICQSIDELDDTVFTRDVSSTSVIENGTEVSWSDILFELRHFPMNSLIFIDRYLFTYESQQKTGCEDGISNIKNILNELLPEKLDCSFQILIIIDGLQKMERNYDFKKITTQINKIKKSLKRPYNIDMEVISITHNCKFYKVTHDRKIISNYFKIDIPHLLKVFRHGSGEGVCSQDITLKYLFSGAYRKKNFRLLPFIGINNDIDSLKDTIEYAKTDIKDDENDYLYGFNGSNLYDISKCKNRLVCT